MANDNDRINNTFGGRPHRRNHRHSGSRVVTTTDSAKFDNGIVDVSIIPYMRHQLIQFSAEGLRPNRRVYFFFDDVDVTDYILKLDSIRFQANSENVVINPPALLLPPIGHHRGRIGSNTATIIHHGRHFDFDDIDPTKHDSGNSRSRKRTIHLANTTFLGFANGSTFTIDTSGNTAIIDDIVIRGGETLKTFFTSSSSNTVQLPDKTRWVANNYWGTNGANTIILHPRHRRKGRKIKGYITGFDNTTQTLYLSASNTLSAIANTDDPDIVTDNVTNVVSWTIPYNGHYTTYEGKIGGVFSVPPAMFRTGERVFRIIDSSSNDEASCTTRAEYRFVSSGLHTTKNDVIINDTSTVVFPPPPTRGGGNDKPERDPIAQTFFVNSNEYPNGIFLTRVGLYFYNKDEVLPITIQIRPTVNGYPHSYQVIPGGEATLASEYITATTDASVETQIQFESPVYLPPGEYALVVKSDSLEYEVFVSELGSKILGSTRIVSKQPYSGSFFKSQNGSTWDAIQLEDLTFNMYKAVFSTSGNIVFNNEAPSINTAADAFYTQIDDLRISNTTITYTQSYDGVTSPNEVFIPNTHYVPNTGRANIVSTQGGTYKLQATLATNDTDVSPIVYHKSANLIAAENLIDNANFDSLDFTITNNGAGYPVSTQVGITITDYRGTGLANGYANTNSTGNIANITITDGSYGYINTAYVVVTASNATTANAVINVASEIGSSGGPAFARYISRTVTLASGFDAGDLRVWLTAYRPSGTDIKVYYKIKNSNDTDPFSAKNYTLMYPMGAQNTYSDKNNFDSQIEYQYGTYGAVTTGAINAVSYSTSTTTYTTYNQYAIKIVLLTNDTTIFPIVYDMRAIALPGMTS